jgi:integrase
MLVKNKYGVYQIDLTVNFERIRKSTRTKDKKLAEQLHAVLEAEMIKGTHGISKKSYSLEDAFAEAMKAHWKGTKNILKVSQNWELLKAHLDTRKDVSSVTPDVVRHLVTSLSEQGNSNATINRKMATLRTLLNLCVEWGKLTHCPRIKALREPPSRHRVLTDAEEVSIMRFFSERYPEQQGLFEFLLSSANRLSEALKLTWFDVDFKDGVVKYRDTKSNDTIHKPMTATMRRILESRKGLISPFPYTVDMVESYWKQVRVHLGYEKDRTFVIHCLRHTCASRLVASGVDLLRVQAWLGHKSYTTTLKYGQLAKGHLKDVVDSLNDSANANADDFDHSLTSVRQSSTSRVTVVKQ